MTRGEATATLEKRDETASARQNGVAEETGAPTVAAADAPDGNEQTGSPRKPVLPTGEAAQVLGQIVALLSQSAAHRHVFLSDLEWLLMPPLALRQFSVFRHNDVPVGYVSWAFLSDETEARLKSGTRPRLQPGEWKGGDNLWIVDIVAPLGGADKMLAELKEKLFRDRPFKTLAPAPDGNGQMTVEW